MILTEHNLTLTELCAMMALLLFFYSLLRMILK